jgi:hypothetical protein
MLGCGPGFRGWFDIMSFIVQISRERNVVAQPWRGLHGEPSCQISITCVRYNMLD